MIILRKEAHDQAVMAGTTVQPEGNDREQAQYNRFGQLVAELEA